MSENDLLSKLKANNFQVTPGALEVFKNSHIPVNDLVNDIVLSWGDDEKIITTKKAIKVMLNSQKFSIFSKEIVSEIKERAAATVVVPRHLMRTYAIMKRFGESSVTPGQIARISRRKKNTEKIYLEQLVKEGYVKKRIKNSKALYYQIM
ncbi:MAG: hypothetical protein ACFFAU_04825 [Candidatus Hodarchaeota archaeon]